MPEVTCDAVTPDRWDDLAELFGENGAYAGCWCMWWRQTNREYEDHHGDDNRASLRELVMAGREPGLLAYLDGAPAGWVALAPRPEYGRVRRSPLFKPEDPADDSVWSVTCFYVDTEHRKRGLTRALLAAAVMHARRKGAKTLEAYAVVPDGARTADLFPGTPSIYLDAGFEEVGAPSARRRLMRLSL